MVGGREGNLPCNLAGYATSPLNRSGQHETKTDESRKEPAEFPPWNEGQEQEHVIAAYARWHQALKCGVLPPDHWTS